MQNLQSVFEVSPFIIAIVPVVIGLVTIVKNSGVATRFAPFASLVFGIGLTSLIVTLSWQEILVQGIIAGLLASGLYSGAKTTVAP